MLTCRLQKLLMLTVSQSALSAQVEECLPEIAQKQMTTRFIKLHHEIAEMDHIDAPALLAYRGGEVFATIVDIPRQLSRGSEIDATSIEELLQRYVEFCCASDLF